jgi:hypothetical protein
MASPGFLAWLDKQRALRGSKVADAPTETLTGEEQVALRDTRAAAAAASPSSSASRARVHLEQQGQQEEEDEEQRETKPRAPLETPTRALDTRLPPPESQEVLREPARPQPSKKRPRSPLQTSDTAGDEPATPAAAVRSPSKRLKTRDDSENKHRVGDVDLTRDRLRGLRERPAAGATAQEPKKKDELMELRTPIPIPTLLPLDATVDWELGDASMLMDVPGKRSSMLQSQKSKDSSKTALKRPLNASDFSFWRAVDRFYDLDEQ